MYAGANSGAKTNRAGEAAGPRSLIIHEASMPRTSPRPVITSRIDENPPSKLSKDSPATWRARGGSKRPVMRARPDAPAKLICAVPTTASFFASGVERSGGGGWPGSRGAVEYLLLRKRGGTVCTS